MDRPLLQTPGVEYDEAVVMDVGDDGLDLSMSSGGRIIDRTPASKIRSLSDGGGTPQKLNPSAAQVAEAAQRTSKDDSSISLPLRDPFSSSTPSTSTATAPPVTPHRSDFPLRGLSLQMPPQASTPPTQQSTPLCPKLAPLSPQLDHSQIYSSPTNILPRRSRGLDFSRAATSLHHTTLAAQSSPDSSPTVGGRAMTIPGRRSGDLSAPEQTSNSFWSMMGNQERHHISSSLGSAANLVSDSSTSSDEDDIMDEDMDEPYIMTPQVNKHTNPLGSGQPGGGGSGWPVGGGSPAANSLLSFQQRQRPRKQLKTRARGPSSVGFPSTSSGPAILSKSPPTNTVSYTSMNKEMTTTHARRESISWAANQLKISGSESEDSPKPGVNVDGVLGPGNDGQNRVVRRAVTRRSNLLPKSKTFQRVKATLAEEGTPVEYEFRREAEVVRQVRESDMDLEAGTRQAVQTQQVASVSTTTQSSPSMAIHDSIEPPELPMTEVDAMIMDSSAGLGLSVTSSLGFKAQAQKNSVGKGRMFWETFSETSSIGERGSAPKTTPPPPDPQMRLLRGSSSGMSIDDVNMDSPSTNSGLTLGNGGFIFPMTNSSSDNGTPQPSNSSSLPPVEQHPPPSVADVTRRLTKRRRDDDLDPVSFKRRAVSPGMSVHNSPIMQSPMQHAPWGSRPGSNGGSEKAAAGRAALSSECDGDKPKASAHKGRVGYQGMVDTNDGITRLSIE